uniref:KfrA_N domain-containing protein n=1 Tax=Heterorhabditis bacteriophora TaxID=37862 RepID=A0A1I7X4P1_HETBA
MVQGGFKKHACINIAKYYAIYANLTALEIRIRSFGATCMKNGSPGISREVNRELSGSFDSANLSETARKWLEERIAEQVISRVDRLEAAMIERQANMRTETEQRLRAQIEAEMAEEVAACRRREEESQSRCKSLEEELRKKIIEAEESEKKYNEERLAMLAQRSQLERERLELQKERDALQKNEQHTILNKGGAARAPIKLKFGFGK